MTPAIRTEVYKVASGCELRANIHRLPGDTVRPAILWLHGGALIFGDRTTIAPEQVDLYLQAGYVVVAVDYRLAPEASLTDIVEDVADSWLWLRERGPRLFNIDPDRMAVVGHSAGGYLALMAGFRAKPAPRALVTFYGYGDIAGAWYHRPDPFYCSLPAVPGEEARRWVGGSVISGTPFQGHPFEERYRFYIHCRQQGSWPETVTGHDPRVEPEWFTSFCPIRNVSAEYPPALLVHGDQDTDVPFAQSVQMSEELARRGVQHRLVPLVGRGHMFDMEGVKEPVVAATFEQVLAFLRVRC